ncbi:MAG: AAA family ATPase [Bacillota bacterium]
MRQSTPEILAQVAQGAISPARALQLLGAESATMGEKVPPISQCLQELNQLVGLKEIKELVAELYAYIEVQRRRARFGLTCQPMSLHMIFSGNPGTGKTTVARVLGRMFKELGILKKGHVVEVERADLVGEYIGHTAQKTREQVHRALGGVLFIDEAYSLARGGEKDFGRECIDVLVKSMEDHRDELVLILAGYKEEMAKFLTCNPGLRSRFPIQLDFPDYTAEELLEIAEIMFATRQYRMTPEARQAFLKKIKQKLVTEVIPGNARTVRNMVERAIRYQAVRLVECGNCTPEELMTIAVAEVERL